MRLWWMYLSRNVGSKTPVWQYHLAKPCHSLLLGAVFAPFMPSLYAVTLAVFAYLVIGKALVRSAPSLDWIADLWIGSLAIVAQRFLVGDPSYLGLYLWIVGYGWLVLHRRFASP